MANHKSAIKRHRQSLVRRDRNRLTRRTVREAFKKVTEAISSGNIDEANTLAVTAESLIAKAAAKSVYPKITASRSISRLKAAINKASITAQA